MRPYSVAVFISICHQPSISLPRHQNLMSCGLSQPCLRRRSEQRGAARMVAVFDQVARRIAAARAEIDREHRLDVGGAAPVDELVGAERVRLGRHPGKVEPARAILHRPDAVLPVVAGDEIAARIAHDGGRELAHHREHVLAEALLVGLRMAGLEDAAIDAAAEMLDEGAEQPPVGRADHVVAVEPHFGLAHCASLQCQIEIALRGHVSGLPASSGDSTAFFSRIE